MSDLFSPQVAEYAAFRPSYPADLISFLARLAPERALAWDCATGSGQAAVQLAAHFARVLATDASPDQLSRATPHPRIEYRTAVEDDSGAPPGSVDLVTVAQALHWLDLPRFYGEVRRVLKPRGIVAAWCYGMMQVDRGVDAVMDWFEGTRLGRLREKELEHLRSGYREIEFPFDEIATRPWVMTESMTLDQFLGFVSSWSAVATKRRELGTDPVADLRAALSAAWPADAPARAVRWPIGLRAGR